jgi:hypothetical protein
MSKKSNAEKQRRNAERRRQPRRRKRPNPAFIAGIFSNASLVRSIETIAFGELGCALLRALKINPITLLAVPNDTEEAKPQETVQ